MTLLVCLKSEGKLVLACDSRGTFGDPRGVTAQNDFQIKLFRLTDRAGILVAGVGELGATVVQYLKNSNSDPNTGIEQLVPRVSTSLATMFDKWFPDEKFQMVPMNDSAPPRPDVSCILAGFPGRDQPNSTTPQIFSLIAPLNFAPLLHDYGFALNGVSQYALYLLNRLYRPDIPLARATALAHYVITETASQDGKVGGPVRIATIGPMEGYMELSSDVVSRLRDQDQRINDQMASLFKQGGLA